MSVKSLESLYKSFTYKPIKGFIPFEHSDWLFSANKYIQWYEMQSSEHDNTRAWYYLFLAKLNGEF